MFSPLPLRLWCMAAMAPALTEAATQARAKLPTTTGVNERQSGGGGTSPADSADTLAPPRSALQTPGTAVPGKPKAQLVTLSKGLVIQSSPVVSARLASSGIKTSGGLVATSSASRSSGQTLVNGKAKGVVNLTGGIAKFQVSSRQTGSVASSGQSPNLITNPSRMNPPKITLPQTSQTTTTPGSIVMMPHSAAVPSIQSKTSTMGFTSKTAGQVTAPSSSQGSTSSSLLPEAAGGGVAGPRAQSLGAPMEAETVTLPQMGDLATVTNLDMQIAAGMGMSDVGLLSNVDLVAETSKRQKEHERRAERLLRRLRRLQSRQSIAHVQEQLSGFVDHQHKNLQTMAKAMKPQPASSVDLKAELLQSEDVKSLSTAALVSLVRKLQTSQALTLRQRLANASQTTSEGGTSVLRLDEDLCTEMNRVSSTLQMDLKHLEKAIDSDATESSSGGESCDEDYDYDDDKLPKAYLRRRAEWKWATDRSAVASRWTWLQAQVSDLEYRIRQQSDIYRQIRAGKGAVVLGDPASQEELLARLRNNRQGRRLSPLEEKIANLERKNEMSPCNLSTLLSNVDKQSSKLTQQLGNVYSPNDSPLLQNKTQPTTPKTPGTPNGYVDLSGTHSKNATTPCAGLGNSTDGQSSSKRIRADVPLALTFDPPSPAVDNSCQAARCRPVRSYGKRKLLRTSGLHQLNRKAARLSTVSCHCFPPVTPCAMCGGRFNNTQTLNPTVMPMAERIAMLEPSCHQVLSFPQDTPLPIHFEALLKNGEWQHKPLPYKPIRPVTTEKRGPKVASMNDHTRKYKKQLSKNASSVLLSSTKIRNKYEQKQHSRTHGTSPNILVAPDTSSLVHSAELKQLKKRKGAIHGIGMNDAMRKKRTLSTASTAASPAPSSSQSRDTPSPLSVSCPSSTLRDLKEAQRRRRGESAFDINNIVIPYSMAASTRVEKLLYKEIITPKWREILQVRRDGATPSKELASEDLPASLPTPTHTPEQEAGQPEVTWGEAAKASGPTPLHSTAVSPPTATSSTSHDNTTTTSPGKATSPTSQDTPSTSQDTPSASQETPSTSQDTPSTSQETPSTSESQDKTVSKSADNPTTAQDNTTSVGDLQTGKEDVPKESTPTLPTENNSKVETPQREDGPVSGEEGQPASNTEAPETKATSLDKEATPSVGEVPSKSREAATKDVSASSTSKEGDGGTVKVPAPGGNGLILPRTLPPDEKEEEEEDDGQVEDLSDELYAERHMRCEISEKKRFTSVVKKRSRGARADSTGPLGDAEPTPEHLDPAVLASGTPPGTPAMAPPVQLTALVDEELELCGRRRSGSCSSHEDIASGRRRSHSAGKMRSRGSLLSMSMHEDQFDEDCGIEPWGTRAFPLVDEEYDSLFKDVPPSEQTMTRGVNRHASTTTQGGYTYSTATPENSNPTSPVPSSSNSSIIDDDPNDPEWTVVAGAEKPVPQPGLVLKLAKR